MQGMGYQRGERVMVEGHGGRKATLVVWEDRGRGLALTSERGYRQLLHGDPDAPIVGFPLRDIKSRVAWSPNEPPQPSAQSQPDAQD